MPAKKTTTRKKVASTRKKADPSDVKAASEKAKKPAVKKSSGKKPSKKENPVEQESPLSEEEVRQFEKILWEKRREILGDVDEMSLKTLNGNRQDTSGELSNMPIHMADIGTDNYEQEFTLGLIESDRKLLHDVDRALVKISQGQYGVCEGTSQFIGRARLNARPWARYHIDFARKLELGQVKKPNDNDEEELELD